MLTRRGFAGFAPCALCAMAAFAAIEVSAAESTPPAGISGLKRKLLSQIDGPTPGYVTMIFETEIEPGVLVIRHTHPGIETGYVLEGEFDLPIQGQPTHRLKPGDAYQVPAETPHAGIKTEQKIKITNTFVVEKGKPLTSPA
jgi:quercetin dioxygenase-like cupin family protein